MTAVPIDPTDSQSPILVPPASTRRGRARRDPILFLHGFYLLCMLGALFPMLFNGPSDFRDYVQDRTQFLNYFYLAIHLIYLPIIVRSPAAFRLLATDLWAPSLLIGFSALSILWSLAPPRTAVMALMLMMQLVVVAYIVVSVRYEVFIRLLGWACLSACVLSIAAILLVPSYGKMTYVFPGAWQGVFVHKNVLGRFAIFSTALFTVLVRERATRSRVLGLTLSVVLAVGSGSATALIGLAGLGLITMVLANRRLLIPAIAVSLVAMVAYIYMMPNYVEQIARLFGKSATLSGRTTIWAEAVHAINLRPITGFGMGGFWSSEYAVRIRAAARWFVPHAHNGFLEVGLQLGYTGIALLVLVLSQCFARAVGFLKRGSGALAAWPLYVVFFCLLYGAGEANFLRANSFVQVAIFASMGYAANRSAAQGGARSV